MSKKGLRSAQGLFQESPAPKVSRNDNASVKERSADDRVETDDGDDDINLSKAAMRYLENLLASHEKRLTDRFELSEQKLLDKISSLERKVEEKDTVIQELQADNTKKDSQLSVIRAANDHLMLSHDDLEQYGRRYNVRIEGIEYDERETTEQLKVKVENTLKRIGVEVKPDILDRFHRSGKPYSKNGKRYAQTIIRFRYWKPRFQAQKAKKFVRDSKIPVQIRNDLTKRRHALMKRAIELMPDRKDLFTFADANSNLVIRDGDNLYKYNTEEELIDILKDL